MNESNAPTSTVPNSTVPADDSTRDADDIREDIQHRRQRMDRTLDLLSDKVSPRSILADLLDWWDGDSPSDDGKRDQLMRGGKRAGRKLLSTLRDNPLPAALIGAGVIWALASSDDDDDDEDFHVSDDPYLDQLDRWDGCTPDRGEQVYPGSYETQHSVAGGTHSGANPHGEGDGSGKEGLVDKIKDKAQQAGDKVKEFASDAKDGIAAAAGKVKEAAGNARDKVAAAGEKTGETGSGLATDARDAVRLAYLRGKRAARTRGRHGVEHMEQWRRKTEERYHRAMDETPLALGLGAAALGVLAGVLLPHSRREDEWFGETSEELADAAREKSHELVDKAKTVGQRVASKALDAAEQAGMTLDATGSAADSLKDKFKAVGESVKKEAKAALEDEQLTAADLRDQGQKAVEKSVDAVAEKTEKAVSGGAEGNDQSPRRDQPKV